MHRTLLVLSKRLPPISKPLLVTESKQWILTKTPGSANSTAPSPKPQKSSAVRLLSLYQTPLRTGSWPNLSTRRPRAKSAKAISIRGQVACCSLLSVQLPRLRRNMDTRKSSTMSSKSKIGTEVVATRLVHHSQTYMLPSCLLASPPSSLRLREEPGPAAATATSFFLPVQARDASQITTLLNHNMAPSNSPAQSFQNPLSAATAPYFGSRIANPLFQPMTYARAHFPGETHLGPFVNFPGSSSGHQPSSPGHAYLRIPSKGTSWARAVLVQATSPPRVLHDVALQAKHLGQDDKVHQDIDRTVTENHIAPHPPNNFNSYDGSFVYTADMDSTFSNKRSLNVESPAFTPATLPVPRATTISSQAANAAPFTPRAMTSGKHPTDKYQDCADNQGSVTPNTQPDSEPSAFNPATIREFTPSSQLLSQQYETTHSVSPQATNVPFRTLT